MEAEAVTTLDMLNQSLLAAKKIMNLKEMQPSAVAMETGQAKHPSAKVCTCRILCWNNKQLLNTLRT